MSLVTNTSIEEAIVAPVIATAETAADRLTPLMAAQRQEMMEQQQLILSLRRENRLLTKEQKEEEGQTARLKRQQEEKQLLLNQQIKQATEEILAMQEKVTALTHKRNEERQLLQSRQTRKDYLNTEAGLQERSAPYHARLQAERERQKALQEQARWAYNPYQNDQQGNNI